MARLRESEPTGEAENVPRWVLAYIPSKWERDDEPQPEGMEWIPPYHWRDMKARARWQAARGAWLHDHGVPRSQWHKFRARPVRAGPSAEPSPTPYASSRPRMEDDDDPFD